MSDQNVFASAGATVIDQPLKTEIEDSYLEYSYSVITSRALPDARDGLKPVHRRILHAMNQMNLTPTSSFMKSARVVGEVMGRWHPHGDSAIYDAMVRLAQDFALNVPMIDGHGNWGSVDDAAAASRYTEARMSVWASLLVEELKEGTVDWRPNYDGSLEEPVVLPVPFPNLLVNGSSGIAVGMSTNMIPHNFTEVMGAARWLLTHPNATLDKVMEFIPGPDLPTGGLLTGLDEVRRAYEGGRGVVKMRARHHTETVPGSRGRSQVVVTELPYGVGPEKVIEAIKKEITSKRLQGVSDVKDLTDRVSGTRLVIEAKVGVNIDVLAAALFKYTPLETSFGIINLALVDGQPRVMGLVELLTVFVDHRIDVVRRRSEHRRTKALDRLHLVEGILTALIDIDRVIAIIRAADNAAAARDALMAEFGLSDTQTQYILDTPLRRLTKYDRLTLETERDTLTATIADLTAILTDENRLRGEVATEFDVLLKTQQIPRRTLLVDADDLPVFTAVAAVDAPLEEPDTPCTVTLSVDGLLARTTTPVDPGGPRGRHDAIVGSIATTTRGEILLVTNRGRAHKVPVITLPTVDGADLTGGLTAREAIALPVGDTVVGVLPSTGAPEGGAAVIGTRDGILKLQSPAWPLRADDFDIIALKDGDEVVAVHWQDTPTGDVVFVTTAAQLLRFPTETVRAQGSLTGGGVAGIKLGDGQKVVAFTATGSPEAVVVTTTGTHVKVTPLAAYPPKGRATGGVRCMGFAKTGGQQVETAYVGPAPRAHNVSGDPVDLPPVDDRRDSLGQHGRAERLGGSR